MNGNYPYVLKKRISSDNGHLSNRQALELFTCHRGSQLTHLVLAHLSKNNNTPELVERLFTPIAGATKIVVASRFEETPVFCIEQCTVVPGLHPETRLTANQQLSLF